MSTFKITYELEADNLNDAMNVAHLLLLNDEDADVARVNVEPIEAPTPEPAGAWVEEPLVTVRGLYVVGDGLYRTSS